MRYAITWSPAVCDKLIELCSQSDKILTYTEIAAEMTKAFGIEFTRNACIGKARRLGQPQRPNPGNKKPRAPRLPKMRKIDAPIQPKIEPRRLGGAIDIYQLGYSDCRFPLAELDDKPPFLYCGEPVAQAGSSWCPYHEERVFAIPRTRRSL